MNTPELLWKYVQGECSAQEKAAVETRLAADPKLRDELKMIRKMHLALADMEPEQPSMRFTTNVMEALPKLYSPATIEPLVMPVWKRIFWGAVVLLFSGLLFWGKNASPAKQQPLPYIDDLSRGIGSIFKAIPSDIVGYFVPLVLVIATLLIIDKILISRKLNFKKM